MNISIARAALACVSLFALSTIAAALPPGSAPPTTAPTASGVCKIKTAVDEMFTGSLCESNFCLPGHQISLVNRAGHPYVFACTPCNAGLFSPAPGEICSPCETGYFSNATAASACHRCPKGTYSDQSGSQFCKLCPAGSVVDSKSAATECNACRGGKFSSQSGSTSCSTCAPGTYSASGAVACSNCSAGYYQDMPGEPMCKECPPGQFSASGAGNCTKCAKGMYVSSSRSETCVNCSAGRYNSEEGRAGCQECRPGWIASSDGSEKCIKCPAGTYNPFYGGKECIACPVNYFSQKEGSVECSAAPDTFTTIGNASTEVVCANGYYESNENGTRSCVLCSDGMVCTQKNVQLANLQLKEGYWRVSAASSKVYECSWKGCAGGSISTDGADSLCAEGYEGPECQTCADGYYENSFAGSCSQCDGASVSAALVALVVSLGIICVAVLYCAASQGMKLRVKVGAANNAVGMQSGSDSSCIDMGWWSRFVSGICCPLVSEHVLSHVFASLRTKVKILFVTFQIVSGFEKNVNVEMPSNYLGLLNILSFLNLDIKSVFPIDCWISSKSCAVNYFGEILILTIAPIALSLLLLFFYMAFRVYISFWIPDKVERGTTLNHGYVFCFRVFIAITYIVFPPVSSKLFAVFHYAYYNDSTAGMTNECYVESALCVSCTDSYYEGTILPYVIFMIIVYPLGIPALYFLLLYRQREEIYRSMHELFSKTARPATERRSADSGLMVECVLSPQDAPVLSISREQMPHGGNNDCCRNQNIGAKSNIEESKDDDDITFDNDNLTCTALSPQTQGLSLLYALYLPSCLYFELFECVRRLSLSGLMVFYMPGSPFQCVIGILISVFALRIYAAYQPFLEKPNYVIAEMCQWQILFTLVGFLLIRSDALSATATVGAFLLALNIGLPMLGITIALNDAAFEMQGHKNLDMESRKRCCKEFQLRNHKDATNSINPITTSQNGGAEDGLTITNYQDYHRSCGSGSQRFYVDDADENIESRIDSLQERQTMDDTNALCSFASLRTDASDISGITSLSATWRGKHTGKVVPCDVPI